MGSDSSHAQSTYSSEQLAISANCILPLNFWDSFAVLFLGFKNASNGMNKLFDSLWCVGELDQPLVRFCQIDLNAQSTKVFENSFALIPSLANFHPSRSNIKVSIARWALLTVDPGVSAMKCHRRNWTTSNLFRKHRETRCCGPLVEKKTLIW